MNKWMSLTLAASSGLASTATAGTHWDNYYLSMGSSSIVAYGALGSVRAGGGPSDLLDCAVQVYAPGNVWVVCAASNDTKGFFCVSTNANFIKVGQTLQSDSYIYFSGAPCTSGSSACCLNQLIVYNGSPYYPTQP